MEGPVVSCRGRDFEELRHLDEAHLCGRAVEPCASDGTEEPAERQHPSNTEKLNGPGRDVDTELVSRTAVAIVLTSPSFSNVKRYNRPSTVAPYEPCLSTQG